MSIKLAVVDSVPEFDEEIPVSDDQMARLSWVVANQARLMLEVQDLEAKLASVKRKHDYYSQKIVPDLMSEIGLREVKTRAGIEVAVEEKIFATFPKDPDRADAAVKHLVDSGNGGMIKREYLVSFERDKSAEAEAFERVIGRPSESEIDAWAVIRSVVQQAADDDAYLSTLVASMWPGTVPRCPMTTETADVDRSQNVHHSTLMKFLREARARGDAETLEVFGALVREVAKIKM